MKPSKFLLFSLTLLLALPAAPQQVRSNVAASASTAVPPLIPYSGVVSTVPGAQPAVDASITFLIYKEEQGGEPLFAETQTVAVDATGHYKAQLGATMSNGIPMDLFATGEARWLEVQVAGEASQPRVLLVSVPYALKAADAATLGGLPPSAFALARAPSEATGAASSAIVPNVTSNVTTTGGGLGFVPEFSGTSSVVDSPIFVNTTGLVGIGTSTPSATLNVNGSTTLNGQLLLPATGTATAAKGFNSQLFKVYTSAFNSSSHAVVNPRFELEAEVTGDDTAAPGATLNLLSSTTTSAATESGFYFNTNGTLHFAPGQTFPGTGAGTITGVAAGTGLTGGGTSGNVTLNVDTTKVPLLATNNSFTGNQSVTGNITANGSAFLAGPVGIGTTAPLAILDVEQSGASRSDGTFRFFQPNLASGNDNSIAWGRAPGQAGLQWYKYVSGGRSVFGWNHWGDNASLTIQQGGKVGVGTMSPTDLLHVAGGARIEGGLNLSGLGSFIGINRNVSTGVIYNPTYTAYQIGQEISSTGGDLVIEQYYPNGSGSGIPFLISPTGHLGLGGTLPDASAALSVGGNLKIAPAGSGIVFADGTKQTTAAGPGAYALLAANNSFVGNQTITGNLSVSGTASAGVVNAVSGYDIKGSLFATGSTENMNAYLGFAGNISGTGTINTASGFAALHSNTTGPGNTANGYLALYSNTKGAYNSATGSWALYSNTTGNDNTASGLDALYLNTTGSYNTASNTGLQLNTSGSDNTADGYVALTDNTLGSGNVGVGYLAGYTADESDGTGSFNTAISTQSAFGTGSITNATAIGAFSEVDQSNALVLGCIAGVNFCPAAVSVGIGTTTPDNLLTVNGTADKPGGGSWGTYSDVRLKTVNGSYSSGLDQVLQLHPIRYRYKPDNALGIRDLDEHIGVVAQEVQRVIPEAVTENGKGYLLVNNDPIIWSMVNAIKEQQREIEQQQKLLRAQSAVNEEQGKLLRAQGAAMQSLAAEVRETRKTLRQVKAEAATGQLTWVASK